MNTDTITRAAAVVAAALLLATPYREQIAGVMRHVFGYARQYSATLARLAAAALIVAAGWGKIPLPKFEPVAYPAVAVETPSVEMQAVVKPIAVELAKFPHGDRLLWASTWAKAAIVVAGDAGAKEVAFTDSRSLQLFTALTLDIAWRRIAAQPPGNEPLRKAIEAAYAEAVGTDDVPVSRDIRTRYAEFAKAVAWAGLNGG